MELKFTDTFGEIFWGYNLPLQICEDESGGISVLNYMPRKNCVEWFDCLVGEEERRVFCHNTAAILRNLAMLFEAFGDGKIDIVYYPDEPPERAVIEAERERRVNGNNKEEKNNG